MRWVLGDKAVSGPCRAGLAPRAAALTRALLRSAELAAAVKRGDRNAGTVRRKVAARTGVVAEAPEYDSSRIIGLREGLGVSQPVFADIVGVKPITVKAWEQGNKVPSGAARRLLQVLETQPQAVMRGARMREAGGAAAARAGGAKRSAA